MSSKEPGSRPESASPNLSGVRLFKSMVRRVRQRMSENRLSKAPSISDDIVAKLEELSVTSTETSPQHQGQPKSPPGKEALRRLFGASGASSEDRLRSTNSGYSSDSGNDKLSSTRSTTNNDCRVRIRQNLRSRSKSYSRTIEKKPKKILRPPATYDYVRGPSGLVSHRVRVYWLMYLHFVFSITLKENLGFSCTQAVQWPSLFLFMRFFLSYSVVHWNPAIERSVTHNILSIYHGDNFVGVL